jgi:hypothetical protein
MQQVWLALIGGLILGWLIEWIIDWQFWRRNIAELRKENQALRQRLDETQAQLAALHASAVATPGAKPSQPDKPVVAIPPADPRSKGE